MDGLDRYHDFYVAAAGVAGALIGLLFVALSVAHEPDDERDRFAHRFRGASALTAFTNALVVSLFLLIPHIDAGWPVLSVSLVGIGFLARSLSELRAARGRHTPTWQDHSSLISLLVVFALQAVSAARLLADDTDTGPLSTVAVLVVVCYLIGIARAWAMVGGPRMTWRS